MGSEQKIVTEAQAKWIAAVRSLNPDAVTALYDPVTGTLLGTVDTQATGTRVGAKAIHRYFEHFLDRQAVEPHFPPIGQQNVQAIGPCVAASGYYDFNLTSRDGQSQVAHAKFTFIWGQKGTILLHNSGFTPEGITKK